MNATSAQFTSQAAQQSFDAAEFVVRILDNGVVCYEEIDCIALDLFAAEE